MSREVPVYIQQLCKLTIRRAAALMLALDIAMLMWMGYRCSPTIDEPAHLVAGLSHWKSHHFDLYRVNPPLVRLVAALPVLLLDPKTDWTGFTDASIARPEFTIGNQFVNTNGHEALLHTTMARWACIPFNLLGAWFCFRWAKDLYGPVAALLALTLWCFCPNILAYSALITPDASAAALGVGANYLFWRWMRYPCWRNALLAGLFLGLVELTKLTWIILFPLWPILWLLSANTATAVGLDRLRPRPHSQPDATLIDHYGGTTGSQRAVRASIVQLVCILMVGFYVLNLGYAFEGVCQRFDKYRFISRTLGGRDHRDAGNRFAGTWLGAMPIPLPANYVKGIDIQRADFETGRWSYLAGEHKQGGWWYYYVYAMVVKMPVGVLLLFGSACLIRLTQAIANRRDRIERPPLCRNELGLLAPAAVVFLLVSSQTGFSCYLRYILPVFPFLFVWASQAANWTSKHVLVRSVVILAVAGSVISSVAVYPHSLAYFNELAGGPTNGPRHLLDANIDWGQDLLELKRWSDANPDAWPLFLAYFGYFDPRVSGLDFEPAQRWYSRVSRRSGSTYIDAPPDGWYGISVNRLYDYKAYGDSGEGYEWLRRMKPVANAGYSIRIFQVTQNDIDCLIESVDSGEPAKPRNSKR